MIVEIGLGIIVLDEGYVRINYFRYSCFSRGLCYNKLDV